jgi:hypothetical protein
MSDPVKTDSVNRPSHYVSEKGYELIDIIEDLQFCRASAIKYIFRAGRKYPDKEIEDLQKAEFLIKREILKLQNAQTSHNSKTHGGE